MKLSRSPADRRAMALLAVMVVIILVALAAYSFNQRMADSYRLSQLQLERTQARLAAQSGIERLLWELELPADQRQIQADMQGSGQVSRQAVDGASNFAGVSLGGDSLGGDSLGGDSLGGDSLGDDRASDEGWRYSVVTSQAEDRSIEAGVVADERAGWRFGVTNESAKINIQTLSLWDRQMPGHARQSLLRLPGAEATVVERFLEVYKIGRAGGGQALDRIAQIKQDLERAGGSQGMDADDLARRWALRWTGGDWNHDYRLDLLEGAILARASSASSGSAAGSSSAANNSGAGPTVMAGPLAWRDYLTFYSGQRNQTRDGRPRIFLNDPDLARLQRSLLEIWPSDWANFVIAARQYGVAAGNFSSGVSSSGAASTSPEAVWVPDLTQPATYLIQSPLELIDGRVSVPTAEGQKTLLRSPLSSDLEAMRDYLGDLVDQVTIDPNRVVAGQIDVMTAAPAVLMAVPGMDSQLVDGIISQRRSAGAVESDRSTVAWLVLEQVIDLPTFTKLLPWITVGGDCYSGQVIGFRDQVSPLYRCTVILDGRLQPAVVRNYQPWHAWGRGFPVESLLSTREM
ncbi:hypothetical protein SH139x_001575 [Planctomycetaceae bacterium SH139]